MKPPVYFEDIRKSANERWDLLERHRDLWGAWHQLFMQVQSPAHVVSELLQNADDAGTTAATVSLVGNEFLFAHNGEDFKKEHFESLCRFGYSNKRVLYNIGFRGVGFKSTFSLGDEVRLHTPTLSVAFRKKRFTRPYWLGGETTQDGGTTVRITIRDSKTKNAIEKSFSNWSQSPASLLFFRHLRRLRVGGEEVAWQSSGHGPVRGSAWLKRKSGDESPVLLVRSRPEEFPREAIEEIRHERGLGDAEEATFPPCQVEIVLGLEGRLFVVLP